MGIAALIVFVFGVVMFFKRRSGGQESTGERELGGRIGRSVQGAVPLPGLTGQPGAHMMPGRLPDEIGPEDEHVVVVKAPDTSRGDPARAMSTDEIRARLDAAMAEPAPPRRRKR